MLVRSRKLRAGSPYSEHLPARRPLEAEREPEQGRLAAAVRAGDRDELALLDAQVDVLQHLRPLAVREVDPGQLER